MKDYTSRVGVARCGLVSCEPLMFHRKALSGDSALKYTH